MYHRREIDGLRAVAVLPVIFFHAGFQVFGGGFVGVDVFFVISGFLITSILIDELETSRFSFLRFAERRARRILPALFVVIAACLPFAYAWMQPVQLKNFSQSAAAAVLSLSNILFWLEAGYFDLDSELKPLLHTWSLGVEEQYYLLFPAILWGLWRFGRKFAFWVVVTIAALSLGLCEWGSRQQPEATFYLLPMRAWELLAGSICAFLGFGKAPRHSDALGLTGLGLIGYAMLAFDENTRFPSLYAALPVLGTALVLAFGGKETWTARLLSARPLVGIGLISYSAYLWHQPIFAFARLRSLTDPAKPLMFALATLSLLLAYATWRWVEQPFRRRPTPLLPKRVSLFATAGLVGAMLVAIGLAGQLGRGFPGRFSPDVLKLAAAENNRGAEKCLYAGYPLPKHPTPRCLRPDPDGKVSVMVIGDSHGSAMSEVLVDALASEGIGSYSAFYIGCVPLRGFQRLGSVERHECAGFVAESLAYAKSSGINTIVLIARFPFYLHGARFDNGEGGVERGEPAIVTLAGEVPDTSGIGAGPDRLAAAFDEQIRQLATEFNVVLVYPIPEAGWNVPQYVFKNALFNGKYDPLSTAYDRYLQRNAVVSPLFDRLDAELPTVFGARVQEVLCAPETGRCANADARGVLYFDDDHLSITGTRLIVPVILDAVRLALAEQG